MIFTNDEIETLNALMDVIIPADDFAAASSAGVFDYIVRLFETDLRARIGDYQSGLKALRSEAELSFSAPFHVITADDQKQVFERILSGNTGAEWPIPAREFARQSIDMVSEGYYADPGNGGNRDSVSWKMIGFSIKEGIRLPVEGRS